MTVTRYNKKKTQPKGVVSSHEGGDVFKLSPEVELLGILATGIDDSFYEKSNERVDRLKNIIDQLAPKDLEFVAKALVYARDKQGFGQRTVTHVGATFLAPHLSGNPLGAKFYGKRDYSQKSLYKRTGGVVSRLDDMLEILACYFHFNKDKRISNAMEKGFLKVFENADTYELSKYKASKRSVSLVDAVNLLHPRNSEKNGYVDVPTNEVEKWAKSSKKEDFWNDIVRNEEICSVPALKALVYGGLKQFDTVEDKNTKAGQEVSAKVKSGKITKEEAEVELKEAKSENYKDLITNRKIGYLALLRNLRNILNTDVSLIPATVELLKDEAMIVQSGVFPHQIDIATEILLLETSGTNSRKVVSALNDAYELAVQNVKKLGFDEHTAVVIDTSASMNGGYRPVLLSGNQKINATPAEKAALIGATLAKGVNGDVFQFANTSKEMVCNHLDSINTLKREFMSHNGEIGHGTYMDEFFRLVFEQRRYYQRIFMISDGEIHDSLLKGSYYQKYCNISPFGKPYIYSIDLCGYGNTPFKQDDRYFPIMGYSASIYETAKMYEVDYNALINQVKKIII